MNVAGRWKDWAIGHILLNDMFKGSMAIVQKKFIYADFPGKDVYRN